MKTLLHVVALLWGTLIVYNGLTGSLPSPPLSAYAWGGVLAFGFGVLMAMVGALYLGRALTGSDGTSNGNSTLLMVLVAVGVTAGAVALKGRSTGGECAAMVRHLRTLATAQDTTGAALARFEESRLELLEGCKQMTGAARRCILRARSLDDLNSCP